MDSENQIFIHGGELKMSSLNEMKEIFDEIVELCEKAIPEYGENASYFLEPASEEEISEWEQQTNISIPETYKLWLKLTRCCQIRSSLAEFFFPDTEQLEYVPEDYVIIGNIIGDGELVCFSKSTKKFIRYFEGRDNGRFEDFIGILEEIKSLLKDELPKLNLTEEKIQEMMKKLEEIRKKKRHLS